MANEIIRPSALPVRTNPVPSEVVPSDNSVTVGGVSWEDGVNSAVPPASQPEAEAGVINSKRMTPLTTKQAIDAQVAPKISSAIGALNLGSASQSQVSDFATAAQGDLADTAVQPSRTVGAGTGLTGGGDLAANRTIALNSASIASLAKADTSVQTVNGNGPDGSGNVVVDAEFTQEQDSRASALLATFAPAVSWVRTAGYASAGDGGGALYIRSAIEPSHDGKFQSADGAWWELAERTVTPRMFGAKGDYSTDDTLATDKWLAFFSATGIPLDIGAGVYRRTEAMVWPKQVIIRGPGGPRIASFPQYDEGDKSNLRPGYKHLLSGASFVFGGTPTVEYTTDRSDKFASVKPCVLYDHFAPPQVSGFAIIQDMDVYTADGVMTTAGNDNKAGGYTAGLVTRATLASFSGITVFGYFNKAGLVLVNKLGDGPGTNNDPDYPTFNDCLITGGTAIIGGDTATPLAEGNTGARFVGTGLYGADHHNRADTDPTIPCLYIDIALTTIQQGRGHSFEGCNFRTCADDAIVLDHCNDISFLGGTTEFSEVVGVPGLSNRGEIKGTANTGNLLIAGMAATGHLGLLTLKNTIAGALQVIGTAGASLGAFLVVQNEVMKLGGTLQVVGGSVTPTQSYHLISGAASATITNIDITNIKENQKVAFRRSSGSAEITFEKGGNLAFSGTTRILNSGADYIEFIRAGSNMFLIAYEDNA